jgi:hypothetical protein
MMIAKLLVVLAGTVLLAAAPAAPQALDIGSRLELFVDDALVAMTTRGAALTMHPPTPREVALVADSPWEGTTCGHYTVFRDGDRFRMYYRGQTEPMPGAPKRSTVICYAESTDGIRWTKPELGIVEWAGSKRNNIVWNASEVAKNGAFAVFKDANPACPPDARYKAVATKGRGLVPMKSPDGLRWSLMRDTPVITRGAFDSQNLALWDAERREYRAYVRDFNDDGRDVRTCTSADFVNWSDPVYLKYPTGRRTQFYTSQIAPYYRAPHIWIGFPARYVPRVWDEQSQTLPPVDLRQRIYPVLHRTATDLTDTTLMASRDGSSFYVWDEAFIRPGYETAGNWIYGDNYQCWGILETRSDLPGAPNELSVFATEGYRRGAGNRLRRFTLRVDGFASVHAPLAGGDLQTRPIVFRGSTLVLNFATSAAGAVRVEIQDEGGGPIPGFGLADCPDLYGDALERTVSWKGGRDVRSLAGRAVRLRFELKDADLYSFRFRE